MEQQLTMNRQDGKLLKNSVNNDRITPDKVVGLRFRIIDGSTGHLLQYGDELVYLHGGYGGAFPKVERAMEGRRVGDRIDLTLSPEEGYGRHQPDLVLVLPSEEFAGEILQTGTPVDGELPDGRALTFTVAAISNGQVTLDANHPFAGKHLAFQFEVLEVRDSMDAERAAGFAFDGMFC
jgi:FKBP-type peptidyl-prolyl cis-trans isomerase SlyD